MSVTTTGSYRRLKRVLDEPPESSPKCKQTHLTEPLATGLSPCLRPTSPTPKPEQSQSPSRAGPYFLLERCEGDESYRAQHTLTKQQYTCQVLPLPGYHEQLAAYDRLHHDNICSFQDVVIGQNRVYVFLPDHYGDMHAYVRSRKHLAEEEVRHLFFQVLSAVEHCHQQGVILRDLKLRRFVFTDQYRTRVALLGLKDCVLLHGDHDDSLTDRHGCPAYVSPELLTNGRGSYSGRAADIWSLGVSLYTMLIGRYPFQDTKPAVLFAKIRSGTFSLPEWLSPQAKCLIGCMLRKCPAERLEASELLMHPWLTKPCTPPHSVHKAPQNSQQTQREDEDQVVPTWTHT